MPLFYMARIAEFELGLNETQASICFLGYRGPLVDRRVFGNQMAEFILFEFAFYYNLGGDCYDNNDDN